jgi:PilZ domain-containing protein
MPDSQEDADDLFGASAAAEPRPPFPTRPAAENRKESRVRAKWQVRVLLGGGRIVELNLFDLSESGIGLVTEVGIPAHSVLNVALAVPGLNDAARITPVTGTIKTTHMTVKGHYIHCGGLWVEIPSASRDLLNQWVRRLRH